MDEFYRVPLTTGEAIAALAGLRALRHLLSTMGISPEAIEGDFDPEALASAAQRIEDETPEYLVAKATHLERRLYKSLISQGPHANFSSGRDDQVSSVRFPPQSYREVCETLQRAWEQEATVEIVYLVQSRGERTRRRVDITAVYEADGKDYLEGYCHLRQEDRLFRIDSVEAVQILDDEDTNKTPAKTPEPFREETDTTRKEPETNINGSTSSDNHANGEPRRRGRRSKHAA